MAVTAAEAWALASDRRALSALATELSSLRHELGSYEGQTAATLENVTKCADECTRALASMTRSDEALWQAWLAETARAGKVSTSLMDYYIDHAGQAQANVDIDDISRRVEQLVGTIATGVRKSAEGAAWLSANLARVEQRVSDAAGA